MTDDFDGLSELARQAAVEDGAAGDDGVLDVFEGDATDLGVEHLAAAEGDLGGTGDGDGSPLPFGRRLCEKIRGGSQ